MHISNRAPVSSSASLYLGRKRTLYLGPMLPRLKLSLAASRLLVSPEAPLRVRVPGQPEVLEGHTLVLPVGMKVLLECGPQPVADCHLDVTGLDLACLSTMATRQMNGMAAELENEATWIEQCRQWIQQPPSGETVQSTLEQLILPEPVVSRVDFHLDPRIATTIELIQRRAADNPPLSELAAAVGLSNSRLVNLFKSQVGVPVRRYRLWHRLFLACTLLARDMSITEAALEAGFTDAAHLNHVFRDILSISPTQLFGKHRIIQVYAEGM